MSDIRQRVFTLLEPGDRGDPASRALDLGLMVLIVTNVAAAMAETMPGVAARYGPALERFEQVSVTIFTVEYLLRVWSCTAAGVSGIRGRLRFMLRPLLLIDLFAFAPFYLAFLGVDLRTLRLLRMARIARLAKLGRYSAAMQMLGRGVWSRKEELLLTCAVALAGIALAATAMFYAEHRAQPTVFSSIPAAFWWAVTTMTTVGYGDTYPITLPGRLVGAFVQLMGVGLVALPAGILAAAFQEQLTERRAAAEPRTCPHCGRLIGD